EVTSRGERIVRNDFERTHPAAVATDPVHARGRAGRRVLLQSIEHAERGRGGVSVPDEEHSSGAVALAGHRETWGKVPIDPIVDGLLAHGGQTAGAGRVRLTIHAGRVDHDTRLLEGSPLGRLHPE